MTSQKLVTPLYQGMTRPILLMGAERENIVILGIMAFMLCFSGKDLLSCLLATAIFIIGRLVSKVVAKTDPWATKIFLESFRYQGFYSAREKIDTPSCLVKRKRKI